MFLKDPFCVKGIHPAGRLPSLRRIRRPTPGFLRVSAADFLGVGVKEKRPVGGDRWVGLYMF